MQTSNRKNRRTLRPGFWIGLFVLGALLITFGILQILNGAEQGADTQKGDPDAAPTLAASADETVSAIEIGGTEYLAVSDLSTLKTVFEGDSFAVIEDANGARAVFSAALYEYVDQGRLYLSAAMPQIRDGKLYLDTQTASRLFPDLRANRAGEYALFSSVPALAAPADSGLALPADQDGKALLKQFLSEPDYLNAPSSDEVDLPSDLKAEYLRLVNVEHPLEQDFAPTDLEVVADARYGGDYAARLRHRAAVALNLFLSEAKRCGYSDVSVTSGYRSYADQSSRFTAKVNSLIGAYSSKEEAEKAAATEIQYPGKSEHQSGLACDMHNLPSADTSFGNTKAGQWLAENAHKFGFILRYPADKTEITGISYEPWHFRYVGRYHATRMYYLHLTLEEYTEFLENNRPKS